MERLHQAEGLTRQIHICNILEEKVKRFKKSNGHLDITPQKGGELRKICKSIQNDG